jgi:hypothetical protein
VKDELTVTIAGVDVTGLSAQDAEAKIARELGIPEAFDIWVNWYDSQQLGEYENLLRQCHEAFHHYLFGHRQAGDRLASLLFDRIGHLLCLACHPRDGDEARRGGDDL